MVKLYKYTWELLCAKMKSQNCCLHSSAMQPSA